MSLAIEFYSANPQELISLFAEDLSTPLSDAQTHHFLHKQRAFSERIFHHVWFFQTIWTPFAHSSTPLILRCHLTLRA